MKIGSGTQFLKPFAALVLLLVGACAVIVSPGTAQAQTGNVVFSQSSYTADVTQSNALITVLFSGSTVPATVDYMTGDGTAFAGIDYVAVSNTLFFAAGTMTNSFSITLLSNPSASATQSLSLTLLNPTGGATLGIPSTAVLSIINNNLQQLEFSQSTYSVDDTDSVAIITLVRTGTTNGDVTVDFKTSDGSAKAGVDYTMTTGTVEFAAGVVSNTVEIPILPPGLLETNQTVKLTLSNATGGATLGNPSNAQLTIVATGPPVIQLSAGTYSTLVNKGRATVTAIRFGDSSVPVSVSYATSDGTAVNGVDYFGSNGSLPFAIGASQSSFSFALQKFSTFQSNKTVNVAISDPVGADLGTQTTAVVTIINSQPQTIVFTNSGGGVVTMSLKRGGTMTPSSFEPLTLALSATTPDTTLTIKVKKSKTGTGTLEIDQITGDGSCRLINATGFDVTGAGIQLDGSLKQLKIRDLLNGGGIIANGSPTLATVITARNLDDDCVIDIGSRLSRLNAARLGDDSAVTAPTIGKISINGDKRNGIPGDCGAVITIAGDGIDTNDLALSQLAVSGTMNAVTIDVANGSIGSISAFQMIDSDIFIGFTPDDPANPLNGGTFDEPGHIRAFNIRSTTNGFANSDLIAATVGSVAISSVVIDNGGTAFGIVARDRISGVNIRTPKFKFIPSDNVQTLGDFQVKH